MPRAILFAATLLIAACETGPAPAPFLDEDLPKWFEAKATDSAKPHPILIVNPMTRECFKNWGATNKIAERTDQACRKATPCGTPVRCPKERTEKLVRNWQFGNRKTLK